VIYAILAAIYGRAPMYAVHFPGNIPDPVYLQSEFMPNEDLTVGTKLEGLSGPESIVECHKKLYTGLSDGRIVKIAPLDGKIGAGPVTDVTYVSDPAFPTTIEGASHGRPLGLRVIEDQNLLFVADAVYGIYMVNITTGQLTMLVQTTDVSPALKFPNDVALTADRSALYFTDVSAKFNALDLPYILLEGTCDGRILKYDFASGDVTVVMDDLCAPNSLQFNEDESRLIFTEYARNRVRIVDTMTWDTINLVYMPTYVDNVRMTNSGNFLIAGSVLINFDKILVRRNPVIRQWMASAYTRDELLNLLDRSFNAVYEMDHDGNLVRVLYDVQGKLTYALSHAYQLSDGRLALGSFMADHMSFVDF